MKHLIRAGAVLGILIIVFLLLKFMPVPTFLEWCGFYRGGNNAEEWADQPMQYVAVPHCGDCHQQRYNTWLNSKHNTVSCENCHGPAKAHVETNASLVIDTSREFCGVCHAELLGRRSDFPQVDMEKHGGQAECITCHNPHDPEVTAGPAPIPHSLEGYPECTVCHQVGGAGVGESGGTGLPPDHEGRTSETCLSCHE